jgi:HK97 family phage portal protein
VILSNGTQRVLAPQAFAELSPQFYNSYFVPRTGLDLETTFATYAELYRRQPWVNTVVNKISNLIARLGLQVWDMSSPTGKMLDTTGPYAKLIAKPSPYMDSHSFWQWVAATIEIFGETFLIKIRENGRVVGFAPMHPAQTKIHRNQDGTLTYQFLGHPNQEFHQDDIVPFRSFDPFGAMRGMSRLEPLRSTLMSEDSARRATASWWRNMGRPSMVLQTDKKLGPDGRQRVQDAFRAVAGGSSNAGGIIVLEDDLKATSMQLSAEEMQYIESRKLNREEVCAVYDIPPAAVHVHDHSTYSNVTEMMRSVYRDSMAPRIAFIESVLDWYVGGDFAGENVARFAVAEVLRGDFEARAEAMSSLVQSGIAKPSEARPFFDLDDAGPVADKLYANSAIQPLGTEKPATPATTQPATQQEPSNVVPFPAAKYVRDIGGLIGRGKSIQEAASTLLDKHPTDRDAIREACELIIERQL